MRKVIDRTFEFNKGETYHLDDIYEIQGVLPYETYDQGDIAHGEDSEVVTFKQNVKLEIKLTTE